MTTSTKVVERVRHPIKVRSLTVKRITELSPAMRRITLTGPDLAEFLSASFDDHVKLFVPEQAGAEPNLPTLTDDGLVFDESRPKPLMRDYTPRHYDAEANELDIDFVLHHDGPATNWASQAEVGHPIGIAGPRGSFVVPMDFDWHLLVADESGLPALSRRIDELPQDKQIIAVIKTRDADARIKLAQRDNLEVHWVTDATDSVDGVEALESTLRHRIKLPEGEGFTWVASEYNEVKSLRTYLVNELGMDKNRVRAASYWRDTVPASHEVFED